MRKMTAVLIVAVMLTVLAACGSGNTENTGGSGQKGEETESPGAAGSGADFPAAELRMEIDGVDVYVPMDMYYIADDMVIDLKEGQQTLNGEQALMFMRYRAGYPDADLGRIRAQQTVFQALAKKLMSAGTLWDIPKLAQIFFNDVETNYKMSEIVWLALQCREMRFDDFSVDMIPGHISGADYVVDPEDALLLINEKYNPYVKPITTLQTAQ